MSLKWKPKTGRLQNRSLLAERREGHSYGLNLSKAELLSDGCEVPLQCPGHLHIFDYSTSV